MFNKHVGCFDVTVFYLCFVQKFSKSSNCIENTFNKFGLLKHGDQSLQGYCVVFFDLD